MNERIVETIMALGPNHAKIAFDTISHPAELVCRPLQVERESDDEIRERMRPGWQWIREHQVSDVIEVQPDAFPEEPAEPVSSDTRSQLLADHVSLMQSIQLHPHFSTTDHYTHLGWLPAKGTRIKSELLDHDLAIVQIQRSGTGRPKHILQLTSKGMRLCGKAN